MLPGGSLVSFVVSLGRSLADQDQDGDGFTPNAGRLQRRQLPRFTLAPSIFPATGSTRTATVPTPWWATSPRRPPASSTPLEDAELALPTDITGTATDANFNRYTLEYASVDETTFTRLALGTTAVQNGVLGQLDPTVLENGMYRVRLTVEDANGATATDERVYRVTGEAKVGLMTLSFVDLQVPVSGIPITVVRSYDNRVKTQRDFGVGWSLDIKTGKYQHNRTPGDGWTVTKASGPFGLPCTVVGEPRSHLTEVRLSDREFYLFRTTLTHLAPLVGGCVGTAGYEYVDGTLPEATLQVLDNTDIIYTSGDVVTEFNGDEDTGLIYNPVHLRLTTVDGRRYDFDQSGLTHLEDPSGNALNITPAGISHSSGKSIAFERDQSGRITRITDPRGLETTLQLRRQRRSRGVQGSGQTIRPVIRL